MTSTLPKAAHSATRESRPMDDHGAPRDLSSPVRRVPGHAIASRESAVSGRKPLASEAQPYESVARLISETAHDLRAPLSTIREAVRLVRDGDLGNVSSDQRECLSAAINQCNCAVQLVDEMVQSGRFDSGFPNVARQWVSIDEIRQTVEATLQPWMLPRGIHLLWDGPFSQGIKIYADATLLRRLIVNLAGNAIRVTREGGSVLIRCTQKRDQFVMNWSIVDQGVGISPSDLELIGNGKAPAKSVGGLGLMISRQLAAAHFSTLRIESRVGTGTAVSFQTTLGGPAAVAARWVKWRSDLIASVERQIHIEGQRVREVSPSHPSNSAASPAQLRRVRIDIPSQLIELSAGDIQPAFKDQVYLATVSVGAAIPASGTDAFDALLQRTMRITELAYRTGRRNWVIAWDADVETGIGKRSELERLVQYELDAMRMTWGASRVVSATRRPYFLNALPSRLSDLMVRQTLSAAQQPVSDADQVRLGTSPIQQSPIAEIRLQNEVEWIRKTWSANWRDR